MKNKNSIHLISKVNGQLLYENLDELESETLTDTHLKEKVKETINKYICKTDGKTVATNSSSSN